MVETDKIHMAPNLWENRPFYVHLLLIPWPLQYCATCFRLGMFKRTCISLDFLKSDFPVWGNGFYKYSAIDMKPSVGISLTPFDLSGTNGALL